MLSNKSASSRLVRAGVFGLVTLATAAIATTNSADAHRYYRHRHYSHHSSDDDDSYSPKFSSIIVDGNSGAVLTANSPDGLRHPASLTKVMTLYLLFERLESGKIKLDTEMPVSEHASDQDPTKLGLRPGQTLRVEDAIKGIVTRSANDAAVVIGEYIGGSEDEFAKMMTRKAHALGMSRTIYRNASGLPNDEQVTTARDQSTLGRAIQDRFPQYYHYFSTTAFNFRGHTITGHNHLLGSVEGVDGIKTGYIRASGFNLITSIHRGNRFLVGVVMGGRSSGSRDAIMRNLLAEDLPRGATTRTVAAITEHNGSNSSVEVADADPNATPPRLIQAQVAPQPALAAPRAQVQDPMAPPAMRTPVAKLTAAMAQATAAVPPARTAHIEPAPMTSGVIQTQPLALVPGSSEPMKPVRVKTVQVKAGTMKLASTSPVQPVPVPSVTNAIPQAAPGVPETSNAIVARAAEAKVEPARTDYAPPAMRTALPPQPSGYGTGNGVLGVLPASSLPAAPAPQVVTNAAPAPQQVAAITPATQQASPIKPAAVHTGWIVQVGALESEDEAQKRIEAARSSAHGLLTKADPFTEPVIAKDNRKFYRARFAGLERGQAEAVCRTLRRSDISCITIRN
ncbi:MAG TPA: serine hydrolase [Bradyrhizobium sp.]|uniref:serine hydrolase n=1 Tax=Bradyrhizobium sp. TaxID=376 RepID=UPI002C4C6122|nr:serine hydrolase [Bradyrhizobium sp.]HLZ06806.1 serine hydrolase [Bradyrhizobium sp.]